MDGLASDLDVDKTLMKTLVVLINGGNYVSRYVTRLVAEANNIQKEQKIDWIILGDYLNTEQDSYNNLIYNTFPNEDHHYKFEKDLTKKCDEKFHSFKGMKILLDTHDNGTQNGFVRFNDFTIPRIKANPSYSILDKMNIFMTVPFVVYPAFYYPQKERPYHIVSSMRKRRMPSVRQNVNNVIERFNPIDKWLRMNQHAKRLCRTLINIVPNGNGDCCRSHVDTLAAGALLMAEENIKNIKILPHADLKEDENFISFSLENICDKLDYLLCNPKVIDDIRMVGLETFRKGYDVNKSAKHLLEKLNETN